jgi:hypothetical protein
MLSRPGLEAISLTAAFPLCSELVCTKPTTTSLSIHILSLAALAPSVLLVLFYLSFRLDCIIVSPALQPSLLLGLLCTPLNFLGNTLLQITYEQHS